MIDKIEKNHAEVVFLYDMLNEKQAEIQKLIHEADSSKVQFQDELAKSYQNVKDIVDPVVVSGKDAKRPVTNSLIVSFQRKIMICKS